MSRLTQLRKRLSIQQIDALLVTKSINIQYLTGFPAEDSWLVVGQRRSVYITDARYTLAAKKGVPHGIRVQEHRGHMAKTLFEVLATFGANVIGFDEYQTTVAAHKGLKRVAPKGLKLIGTNNVVEDLRVIKDEEEITLTKEALTIHLQAHRYLKRVIRPGVREIDILFKLEKFVKARQAGFAFDPIIASGPNSCYPHAKVTERTLRANEPVLVDMGIDWKGYKSDLTRIFFLGKIPPFVHRVCSCVEAAKREAIRCIKPGVAVKELDMRARDILSKHQLAKYFGHALGHGVGLEIHESPRLSQQSSAVLKEGMILTIEPGVYLPDQFGIRLEDMVFVTNNNCEILSDHIN